MIKEVAIEFNLVGQRLLSSKSNEIVVQQYDRCEEDYQDRQHNMR